MSKKTSHGDGEREPLLQELPPMPTILNNEEQSESANGAVHCENHSAVRRRTMLKRSSILLVIIGTLTLITVYSIKLYSHMEQVVNESATVAVNDVSLDSINTKDKSINLTLDVELKLNYTESGLDVITQNYLKLNSYWINNLNIDLDDLNISCKTSEENIQSLGTVTVQPFNMKIYQGVQDQLKLKVNVKPDTNAVFKALKDILFNKNVMQMDVAFLLKVKVGYLRIPIKDLKLNFNHIVVDPTDLINDIYNHHVDLAKISFKEDEIDSSLAVVGSSIEGDERLSRYINYIPNIPDFFYARIEMESCEEESFFQLGEVKVSGIADYLKDMDQNVLKLVSLDNLPDAFFERCSNETISPVSRLVQSIIYGNMESRFVIKSSPRNKDVIPQWIDHELLNQVQIPYNIPSLSSTSAIETQKKQKQNNRHHSLLQNVAINDLKFNIDNGISNPELESGSVDFDLVIPDYIKLHDLEIKALKGIVDLKNENMKFGYLNIDNWLPCITSDTTTTTTLHNRCQLKDNDIVITDGQVYGELIADYLMGVDIKIEADFMLDALINWGSVYKKGDFEINGLKGSGAGNV